MYNIKKYLAAAALLAALSSCKKSFIDDKPISSLADGSLYVSAVNAEEGLTGAYNSMAAGNGANFYLYDNFMNTDGRSDNCYVNGDNNEEQPLENFTYSSANTNIQRDWEYLYTIVEAANSVIGNVPGINDPSWSGTNRKSQIIGEARFIRAMQYYWLVTEWGDCPLIVNIGNNGNYYPARNKASDVYAQVIADLKYADSVLPATPYNNQFGRATQGAADALLAKTYAQMGDYTDCLTYCSKVIAGPYSLMPNFAHLWGIVGNKGNVNSQNTESILQLQFDGSGAPYGNWGPELFDYISSEGWPKRDIGSADLVNAFHAANDVIRYNATFNWEQTGATFNMPFNAWNSAAPIPFMNKMPDPTPGNSPDNVSLLRLADIILLRAEAYNQLGQPGSAIPDLNQIRTRAGLPVTTASSQSDLAVAILNERRLELVHECTRWNDLLRAEANGTIPNFSIVNLMNSQVDSHGNNLNYNVNPDKHQYLFPIPLQDLQLNKNLVQNPGYN